MDQIYSGYNNTMNGVTLNLNNLLSNPYVTAMVSLFIILYSGFAAPKLPKMAAKLFDHIIFKVLILALILYVNSFNPTIAILVAVGFFLSLQTLSRYNVMDMASEVFNIKKMLGQKQNEEDSTHQEMDSEEVNADMMYTQVSGLAARTEEYLGPQGMKHPVGFGGHAEGADLF